MTKPDPARDFDLVLSGDKVAVTLDRIRAHEPADGYFLAFSGGKDSTVILDLAQRAGVKFDAHYNVTGIDPPELVYHIRQHYPQVAQDHPGTTMWKLIHSKGLPRRNARFCCEALKEGGGTGRTVMTGVRWQESPGKRGKRRLYEVCFRDGTKHYLHPIIDWTVGEVWAYIRERGLPYCKLYDEGFMRLGCVLCPMQTSAQTRLDMARWPKLTEAWHRAALRYWESSVGAQKFPSGEAFWQWWIQRGKFKLSDPNQGVML